MISDLASEVTELRSLGREELKAKWRDLYRVAPPVAFTPDLLARGISWRLQERALGGLPGEVLSVLAGGEGSAPKRHASLRTGNRLVRRWRGRTYVVEVTENGFTYEGEQFGSLSEIACHITGTHWSGPRFFGLKQ